MSSHKHYVITAPEVRETDRSSFKFMSDSGANFDDLRDISKRFGFLALRPYGTNEINPCSLMQGGPAQTANQRIDLHVFESGAGAIHTAGTDFHADRPQAAADILEDLPSCVLLVQRDLYDAFLAPAMERAAIAHGVHHATVALATG